MGQQAVDDQTAMAEQDSIEDLVDLTDYDPYLVQAVQDGIDPTTVPAPCQARTTIQLPTTPQPPTMLNRLRKASCLLRVSSFAERGRPCSHRLPPRLIRWGRGAGAPESARASRAACVQVALLLSVADALREQTWFTSASPSHFTDGPPEASLNITASVDDEGAHQEGGSLWRLAVASLAKRKGPYGRCSGNGKRVLGRVHARLVRSLQPRGTRGPGLEPALGPRCVERVRGALLAMAGSGTASTTGAVLTSGLVVVFVAMLIIGTRLLRRRRWTLGRGFQEPEAGGEVDGTWLIHVQHDLDSASLEGISYTFRFRI